LLDIGEIKHIGNGFFDMQIKRGSHRKTNSYFPIGTSVEEAVAIIEDVILNPKNIECIDDLKNKALHGYTMTNKIDQNFRLLIENKVAQFFPYNKR